MNPFLSTFAERLAGYVALRRKLGFQFKSQAEILCAFDRHAHQKGHVGHLTTDLVFDFATTDLNGSTLKQARRYQVVRNFADYLATFEPRTAVLDPKAMTKRRTRTPAHIYSETELAKLLDAAKHLFPQHPVCGKTLHTIVGLAASTGLRVGEVSRLDRADVDLETGVLMIRCSKFAKDRVVPVHASTLNVLRDYALLRDAHYPVTDCPAFFVNRRRRRYSRPTVEHEFWRLGRQTGLRGPKGKGPRFHDLRHTFAVRRLIAWYKEGAEVQAMLPVLATYMGHVRYSDTAYYLQATAELLAIAADRFQHSPCSAEVER